VIWHLIKDAEFRDNPPNPYFREGGRRTRKFKRGYSTDQPEVHDVIAEMRRVTDEFAARVLIGEVYLPLHRLVAYYGKRPLPARRCGYNFALLSTLWSARSIETDHRRLREGPAFRRVADWVLGNHDRPRVASRVGRPGAGGGDAAAHASGTPTLYYGDEIGMHQVAIAPDEVRDPFEKNVPGIGVGRDGCRTPMQWDATCYAGFSEAPPWLPLADDSVQENVVISMLDTRSSSSLQGADCASQANLRRWSRAATCRSWPTEILLLSARTMTARPIVRRAQSRRGAGSITSEMIGPRRRNPAVRTYNGPRARGHSWHAGFARAMKAW